MHVCVSFPQRESVRERKRESARARERETQRERERERERESLGADHEGITVEGSALKEAGDAIGQRETS